MIMDKKGYLEEAKRIINLPQSCMKKEDASVLLLVHPKHASNIKIGILEELDAMLQRNFEQLNGIPMAYENIKLLSNYAVLLHDNAYAHVHVSATFYVFTPEVGSILPGVVCKKSKNHIGLLVYNKFNVSAICPDGVSIANWCGSRVEEQDEVKVMVTFLNMKGYYPTIKVQINADSIPEHASPSIEIATNTENKRTVFNDDDSGISSNDTPVTEVKKKKKKSRMEDKSDIKIKDEDSSSEDETVENRKKPKKTLFKNIVDENSDLDLSNESKDILTPDSLLDSSIKKKKKKRKSLLEDSQDSPSTERTDDSIKHEGDGSFLSPPSPSKKKKKEKATKMDSKSPAIDFGNDSSLGTPIRKFKNGNLEPLKLELNDSTPSSSAKKKKDKKSKRDSFLMEGLDNINTMTTPIRQIKEENSDLKDSKLSSKKKKKKDNKLDTPENINITPVVKKESEMSSTKSSKKAKKSLDNNDLDDLPFDLDGDMFASPSAKDKKGNKQKSESQLSQSPQIKNKKRKAEDTPDESKSKKKRKM